MHLAYVGAAGHVMARGNMGRNLLYDEDLDRKLRLAALGLACERTGGCIYAVILAAVLACLSSPACSASNLQDKSGAGSVQQRESVQIGDDLTLFVRYQPTAPPGDPAWQSVRNLQREPAGYTPRLPEDQWADLESLGANGLMFYPTVPQDSLLEELIGEGYTIYLGSHYVPLHFRALYGIEEGDNKLLDWLRKWNTDYPGRVWWGCSSESGIDQPDVRWAIGFPEPGTPTCKADAYEKTKAYYLEQCIANTPCKHYFYSQKRLQAPGELRQMMFDSWKAVGCPPLEGLKPWGFGEVMEHAKATGANVKEYNLVMGDGLLSHTLEYMHSFGASRVQSEFNAGCPPVQPTTAFLRGAARAAGIPSFIHWSAWGGNDGAGQTYDEDGKLKTGYSPSMQLRQWVFGWLAGIHSMTIFETAEMQAWYYDHNGKRHLSASAKNFAHFAQLALREGLPGLSPGKVVEPYTPFAVMLERHHGYSPGRDYVWWGVVPWSRDESNIRAFFTSAWPSHPWFLGGPKRSNWSGAPREGLVAEDFEKGLMGDTRWGDTFDAITEDAGPELLARYKVIVLLGGIRLGAELRMKLEDYVKAGGIVVVNAPQAIRNSGKWLGIELTQWSPRTHNDGLPFTVSLKHAERMKLVVPAPLCTQDGKEHPAPLLDPVFLARARHGKGEVYVTTLDYGLNGAMNLYAPFFDGLFDRFLPMHLEAGLKNSVQFMLNPLPKGWLLTVMNHGWNYWESSDPNAGKMGRPSKPWTGTALIPATEFAGKPAARDLWTGESHSTSSSPKADGKWFSRCRPTASYCAR